MSYGLKFLYAINQWLGEDQEAKIPSAGEVVWAQNDVICLRIANASFEASEKEHLHEKHHPNETRSSSCSVESCAYLHSNNLK